ncbi:MAG: hypothetical protein ACLR8Y_16970 [Alistipes indistinctus]
MKRSAKRTRETLTAFPRALSGGRSRSESKLSNVAGVENEIRGNLLRSGERLLWPETPAAFLPMDDVRKTHPRGGRYSDLPLPGR